MGDYMKEIFSHTSQLHPRPLRGEGERKGKFSPCLKAPQGLHIANEISRRKEVVLLQSHFNSGTLSSKTIY